MNPISENDIELIAIAYLQGLGYQYLNGVDIGPDGSSPERQYNEVVLVERLRSAIDRLNPGIAHEAKEDALKKVLRTDSPTALINNETFHRYLTEGIAVEMRVNSGIRGEIVYIADFENYERNEFLAVNQFSIVENNQHKRPDIILFINGLPLVVIELKNATDENATIKSAYNQVQTYKQAIPSLFTYNELLIVSDGWDAKCGTITSDWGRFLSWKTKDGRTTADTLTPQMEVMFNGMLNKQTLLDLLSHFIVFEKSKDKTLKKVAAYHQYYAVNKAVITTVAAAKDTGDRRAGVVWHTQGSGKSLSMVFYTGKMVLALDNPTIVVLTDRNDLDDQLYETFSNCQQLLRQEPKQASDRKNLQTLLSVASGGIVFTTIQKFTPVENDDIVEPNVFREPEVKYIGANAKALSLRKNIVVVADEAHRSQYDFLDGFAKYMRDALPHASFIGFTGTPIESSDRNTQAVFGNYVDIYDIQQAVIDRATVPIFYESRLAKVQFSENEKIHLDDRFEELTESEELTNRQQLRAKWTRLEAIVGNLNRINKIAEDLVYHFEQRSSVLDGKAMIVCMSRRICVEMYDAIIKLRPGWHDEEDDKGAIKVVMTGSSSDELNLQPHIRNKTRRKAIGERLKNPTNNLKLVIVRDMWLTGFDAPCLHTLYVDKPMRGHSLMQAIARVNRVFTEGKEGGLVVDYLGIAQELKHALAIYTESGGEGKPTLDQELAVAKMLELYEAIEYQLRHFDWQKFFGLSPEEKLRYIPVIVDYIFSQENGEQSFVENTKNLLKAFAISVPHEKAILIRDNVALFQAIKARLVKISDNNEGGKSDDEIETAIKQIISEAITADKVIDVFDAAGLKKPNIEILDDRFLQELKDLPQKNLAVELLKKLLKDEIKKRTKINLVESKKFSEMLEDAIKRYHNGMIDTVEFLEKVLIPFANQIKESDRKGEKLGLDYREYAFYTALEVNNSAVSILGDETLKHIAQELLSTVRNSTTIDWAIKESVQSALRRNVRRILRLHGYPPDLQEKAVQTILTQAKMLAEDITNPEK
ncbi:type I restriction endonuclease subunit R [Mucilaginibacter sp.]|uniref:type I restriction endonuclease subunit R n=1 Tax=Mucilaginibacter sp. TaxID=1882438 RepID=UPI00262092E6|nr:type I restriction endonuclease subunit R [Mucilaginibacter sp.]MDB4920646.1 box helicase [Mucilaginibacter sp.]